MKKIKASRYFLGILLLAFSVGLILASGVQKSAEELYEAAIFKKDADGDMAGAIKIFREILERFPGNVEIAAKAQLQIGICYEMLGQKSIKQAKEAFQKVIDNFPEQKEAVKIAQEKLSVFLKAKAALEKADGELNLRQVWAGSRIDLLGGISPDGRYLCFTDWNTGDLAIRELATGKNRRITDKGPWTKSYEFAMFSKWSPDGQYIAYLWYNPNAERFELHLIGLNDLQPTILFENGENEYANVQPFDWHPNGKKILVGFYKAGEILELGFLSVAEKSIQVVKTFNWKMEGNRGGSPQNFVVSPDGSTIAYDYYPGNTSKSRDIFLLSVDGTHEQKLFDHPAYDFVCDWTADGRHLLFASDRKGELGLWAVQVDDRKTHQDPILLKADMGMFIPIGCTQLNQLYVGYFKEGRDIYLAEIDPATGQFLAPPTKQVRLYEGCNAIPEFSPDGKHFTYVSSRVGTPQVTYALCVYSFEKDEIREIDTDFEWFNQWSFPQWRPDGQAISLAGRDRQGRSGIHLIPMESEKSSPVVLYGENETIFRHKWANDGQTLFYTKGDRRMNPDGTRFSSIYTFDLKTGEEKVLQGSPDDAVDFSISPDGKWLVFLNRFERGIKRNMRIIPTTGGEPQELHSFAVSGMFPIYPAWSADGKYIYFSSRIDPVNQEWEMWRFSLEDRKAQKINLNTVSFRHLSTHPDGRHVIFSTEYDYTQDSEVWVLENFLPKK